MIRYDVSLLISNQHLLDWTEPNMEPTVRHLICPFNMFRPVVRSGL